MAQTARNGLLVARDLEVAAWLDRLSGASAEQIRMRFGLGRSQSQWRLQVLRQHGLIRQRHVLAWRPPLYTAPRRDVASSGYEHALAEAGLVVALEAAGAEAISEVELRRERLDQGRLTGRLGDEELAIVRGCRRLPDVVERVHGGGLRAYEIELSSKGRARRESILAAYAASDYASVEWIVPDRRLAALLNREISEMGLEEFMAVRG
jgi:hypothetical protein